MARRQRRRHAGRAAAFVDEHLGAVSGYLMAMSGHAAWAVTQTRAVLGGVDPRLLEEEPAAARRLLLARARRAMEDAPASDPWAWPGPDWLGLAMVELDHDAREAFVLLDVLGLSPEQAAAMRGSGSSEITNLEQQRLAAHEVVVAHLTGAQP